MSITEEDFRTAVESKLAGLTLHQKVHSIQRLYEKLRLIHNAIGAVYRQEKTVSEFAAEMPKVHDKVKTELSPYVEGDYISLEGWNYFCNNMFDLRHMILCNFICEVRAELRSALADSEVEPF